MTAGTPAASTPTGQAYVERRVPAALRWVLSVLSALGLPGSGVLRRLRRARHAGPPPVCEPGGPDVVVTGTAFPGDSRTYLMVPFDVGPGAARLEVEYHYGPLRPALPENPITQTVLDLGLWDQRGYHDAAGFRGWSGSRHGRHDTVFVEAGRASRCYRPGPVEPGTWYAELGLAAVGPTGAEWTVRVRALTGPPGQAPLPLPVDPAYVADPHPGWYHGDFHMHSFHSNPEGPTPRRFVEHAKAAGLDFTPVTEYVVGVHWDEYGLIQDENPQLLIWPGREIVTYFGHMQCIGETPGFIEYRHGFEGVTVADIQAAVRSAGALFQVNHPTTFKGRLFANFCRGCAFELGEEIDWREVDTIEVLNGPAVLHRTRLLGGDFENPFMTSAVELWEDMLDRGYRTTAVSGSDAKRGVGLGSSATAVYARQLSRAALTDGIRAGRAYVRTRGVGHSPALEMTVSPPDGPPGTFGSRFVLDPGATVAVRVVVTGGRGQSLRVIRDRREVDVVAIVDDPFEHRFEAGRTVGAEGPLGTRWRVETFDGASRTTIGNPVFLGGPDHPLKPLPAAPMPPVRKRFVRNLAAAQGLRSSHVM
ncbi:MAG: hypothetical protein QOJ69_1676 [Actinomycetota bacterium]|nr:hypothetical protein [Actinomycetota bacterium]